MSGFVEIAIPLNGIALLSDNIFDDVASPVAQVVGYDKFHWLDLHRDVVVSVDLFLQRVFQWIDTGSGSSTLMVSPRHMTSPS